EHAAAAGVAMSVEQGPAFPWKGLSERKVREHLVALAAERADGRGGWRRELVENPQHLAEDKRALLTALDLLRVRSTSGDDVALWWFSPATGRWSPPAPRAGMEGN